jgi:Tol biopolymer transport system component
MRRFGSVTIATLVIASLAFSISAAHATPSGRNGRIAFRRYLNADHTHGAIFTIEPDGRGIRQVTHPPRTRLTTEPDWSPNGRWIVYSVQRYGDQDQSRIYKIHPNGTDRTSLAGSCTGICATEDQPAWGPYGKRIAFQWSPGTVANHNTFLFVMRADGTHLRQITQRGADPSVHQRFADNAPQWSPSAKRLVFQRYDHTTDRSAIFTVRLDGTGLTRISDWRLDAGYPDWSPNGRWIAFKSQVEGRRQSNVWVVHPNGTDLHRITHSFGGTYTWLGLSFSPDGKFITVARTPGHGKAGNADVYVVRLDGSQLRNITGSNAWESVPDWGPRPR